MDDIALSLRHPSGRVIRSISAEDIRLQLLSADEQYWKTGSGDAEIIFQSHHRRSVLGVMCRPDVGFHFTYVTFENRKPGPLYVSVRSVTYTKRTALFVGGDFFSFPLEAFVDRATAADIIDRFCILGDKSDKVVWLKLSEAKLRNEEQMHGEPY